MPLYQLSDYVCTLIVSFIWVIFLWAKFFFLATHKLTVFHLVLTALFLFFTLNMTNFCVPITCRSTHSYKTIWFFKKLMINTIFSQTYKIRLFLFSIVSLPSLAPFPIQMDQFFFSKGQLLWFQRINTTPKTITSFCFHSVFFFVTRVTSFWCVKISSRTHKRRRDNKLIKKNTKSTQIKLIQKKREIMVVHNVLQNKNINGISLSSCHSICAKNMMVFK